MTYNRFPRKRRKKRNWAPPGRKNPFYIKWRAAVFKRDKGTCRFPGCNSKKKVQAHHIKRYVDYLSLRYSVSNGICLCRKCHDRIHGHEDNYINTFRRIVLQ